MKRYVFVACATKGDPDKPLSHSKQSTWWASLVAVDDDEANRKAQDICFARHPIADGWWNHRWDTKSLDSLMDDPPTEI